MNIMKRSSIVFLFATVFLGGATGAIKVVETQNQYYGVCSSLDGFPGVLQEVGMLHSGTCQQPDTKTSKDAKNNNDKNPDKGAPPDATGGGPGHGPCGGSCTVNGKQGTCTNTGKPGGTPVCTCVANISQ